MNAAPATTSGNNVVAILAAVYSIVLCIFQICLGAVAGIISGSLNEISSVASAIGGTVDPDVASMTTSSGLLAILSVVAGVALLLAATGVFMRRPWAWMLMMAAHAAYVVLGVLGGVLSTFVGIIFVLISAGVVAAFYFLPDIKRALNVA